MTVCPDILLVGLADSIACPKDAEADDKRDEMDERDFAGEGLAESEIIDPDDETEIDTAGALSVGTPSCVDWLCEKVAEDTVEAAFDETALVTLLGDRDRDKEEVEAGAALITAV